MVTRLVTICDEHGLHLKMMEHVEREIGFLLASAREIVDQRKAAREGVSFTKEAVVAAAEKNGLLED